MRKIAVFASGSGTNFQALAEACYSGIIEAQCVLCVTDKPGAYVTQRAKSFNVPTLELRQKDFPSKAEFEKEILKKLRSLDVDLICLAGYMRIVGDTLLDAYPGKIVNIHPSLLPAFRGVDAIGQALDYGVKVFGVTIHYVDNTLDGGKIIAQAPVEYDGTDRRVVEAMIHEQEHLLYPKTVARLIHEMGDKPEYL